ncbi:flagellar basal body-associated protein FliL [Bacillaceae bacterium S4-13-56]
MKGNVYKTMLIILIGITLIGVAAIVVIVNVKDSEAKGSEPSLEEIIENSFDTEEVVTNLKDDGFVKIQFKIVTDSQETKEELSLGEFQIRNIIIKELSKMEKEEFNTGLDNIEQLIKLRLNETLEYGKVTDVYTINKLLQ